MKKNSPRRLKSMLLGMLFLVAAATGCMREEREITVSEPVGVKAEATVLDDRLSDVIALLTQAEQDMGSLDTLALKVKQAQGAAEITMEAVRSGGGNSAGKSDPVARLMDDLDRLGDELDVWKEIEVLAVEMDRTAEDISASMLQAGALETGFVEELESLVAETDLTSASGAKSLVSNLEAMSVEGEREKMMLGKYIELYRLYREIMVRHESILTAEEWIGRLEAHKETIEFTFLL